MTGGIVVGGWEYVIAAYGITFTVVTGYAISVLLRLRAEAKRNTSEGKR